MNGFLTTLHPSAQSMLVQNRLNVFDDGLNMTAITLAHIIQPLTNGGNGITLQNLQCAIIHFIGNVSQSHVLCQSGVHIHRLRRNAPTAIRRQKMQCAHVVQSVRQLHQQNPYVIGYRQQKTAKIFRIPLPLRRNVHP